MKKILVTGSCGFIGMHLCEKLLKQEFQVLGLDNINNYYSIELKKMRLSRLKKYSQFEFQKIDISNKKEINLIFSVFKPDIVVNLAAQAGVRYSIENPDAYITSNINGFINILECCRHSKVDGLIYASSSSVYGANDEIPFSVKDRVDKPISIYAVTKRSNELMAYSYSHLYNLNTTGLRFFTVYGPWGRPDMAMYLFAEKILQGKEIEVYNHGEMQRDFTYIDDIVSGICSAINNNYQCEIFNLGNNRSEKLMDMIGLLEKSVGKKAKIEFKQNQPGDVKKTFADIKRSEKYLNYKPSVHLDKGIPQFIKWFKSYLNILK
jgi:UDP-glucuronate 4-epimerase